MGQTQITDVLKINDNENPVYQYLWVTFTAVIREKLVLDTCINTNERMKIWIPSSKWTNNIKEQNNPKGNKSKEIIKTIVRISCNKELKNRLTHY